MTEKGRGPVGPMWEKPKPREEIVKKPSTLEDVKPPVRCSLSPHAAVISSSAARSQPLTPPPPGVVSYAIRVSSYHYSECPLELRIQAIWSKLLLKLGNPGLNHSLGHIRHRAEESGSISKTGYATSPQPTRPPRGVNHHID